MTRRLSRGRRYIRPARESMVQSLELRMLLAADIRSALLPSINPQPASTPVVSASTLISNGSFEFVGVGSAAAPVLRANLRSALRNPLTTDDSSGYVYRPTGAQWIFTGGSGIQSNGSAWTSSGAPEGVRTAFLQGNSQIDQTVYVTTPGSYQLTFKGALRPFKSAGAADQQIAVYIDGNLANVFKPGGFTSWDSFNVSQILTSGIHTISFRGAVQGADTTAFVDDVSLVLSASLPPQQFFMYPSNAVDGDGQYHGFAVAGVEIVSVNGGSPIDLTPTKIGEDIVDASTVDQMWATAGGEIFANARLTTTPDNERMDVSVTAGNGWIVKNVIIAAPYVTAPASIANKTFSAFKEGSVNDWPTDQWVWNNSSIWPEMGYSPLGVFYNQDTTEGVGIVSFDAGLKERAVYWLTGPGEVHPLVRWMPNIAPGATEMTTVALHHGYNMPTDMFSYYRNNYLKPFMDSQGVPEGTLGMNGVMSTNFWPRGNDVSTSVQWSKSWGANGYLQYAPGDGISYYEPNPEVFSWFPTLGPASTISGLGALGVLINPFRGSHYAPAADGSNGNWYPSGDSLINLNDPAVQNWLWRLKADLAWQGVNFAFWDSGNVVPEGDEFAWFNVLKMFKQGGITIAVESSNDIASYVTGTNFYDQIRADSALVRTVTPLVRPVVIDNHSSADINGQYWWDTVLAKGWVPILTDPQLMIYGALQGYAGLPL